MHGSYTIFLKIPVTETLLCHICEGAYPPEETRVTYCYPPIPYSTEIENKGMNPLGARREILRCFEAFRATLGA